MSKIVNSAVANSIFKTNGSALGVNDAQPNNTVTNTVGGIFTSPKASVKNAALGSEYESDRTAGETYPVGSLTAINGTFGSSGTADGITTYTLAASNIGSVLKKGDIILGNTNTLTRVVSVTATELKVHSKSDESPSITGEAAPYGYVIDQDKIAVQNNDQFVGIGTASTIAGSANTAILGGATSPNRPVNKREAVNTRRVATAIREGKWNSYSGTWTTEPSLADDTTAVKLASDKAPVLPGRVTYNIGQKTENKNY